MAAYAAVPDVPDTYVPKGPRPKKNPTAKRYRARLEQLRQLRQSYFEHWKEISDQIRPRRGRWLQDGSATERALEGGKKNENIINNTPTHASRVQASGIMAGSSSPARPWFRLGVPKLGEFTSDGAKAWLHEVEELIREVFQRSNLYNVMYAAYRDLGDFGTAATFVEEDDEDLVRGYSIPPGQYYAIASAKGRVEGLYRETVFSVEQLVEKFGYENCSLTVQQWYDQERCDELVDVVHVIEKNVEYSPGKLGRRGKRWRSCWFELKRPDAEEKFLRESGFEEFPAQVPRWDVNGENVYGDSPGMDALPDCKGLQHLEKRKLQAVDKIVTPPMTGPTSMRTTRVSLVPGGTTYADAPNAANAFRPAIQVDPAVINVANESIEKHEQRIKQTYFADLWLMMLGESGQMTAREVTERHEEKMLQLGPVIERLQDEFYEPLIDRVFNILWRKGLIPQPPPELHGEEIHVEFISIMAQAQKLLGTSAVERLVTMIGNLGRVAPEALDKLDVDKVIDEYAQMLGVKPDLLRSADAVKKIREAKAKAMQQAAAMQQAQAGAETAKVMSDTELGGDSALNRLVSNLGGAAGAAAGGQGLLPQ
jgi:hypothetical protein